MEIYAILRASDEKQLFMGEKPGDLRVFLKSHGYHRVSLAEKFPQIIELNMLHYREKCHAYARADDGEFLLVSEPLPDDVLDEVKSLGYLFSICDSSCIEWRVPKVYRLSDYSRI